MTTQRQKSLTLPATFYVLTSIGTAAASALQPYALKLIFDNFKSFLLMRRGVILYALTVVLIVGLEYLSKRSYIVTELRVTDRLRTRIGDTIEYGERLDTGQEQLSAINVDLNTNIAAYIETYYMNRLDILLLAISLLVYGYSIIKLDVAMIFIILIPNLIAVGLPYLYQKKVEKARGEALLTTEIFNRQMLDFFGGIRVLKNLFAEKAWRKRVEASSKDNLEAQKDLGYLNSFVECLIGLISFTSTLLLLIYGVDGIAKGTLTIGTLVASFYFAELIVTPIIRLISAVNTLTSGKVLKRQLEDRYAKADATKDQSTNASPEVGAFQSLEAHNVDFAYGDTLQIGFDGWQIKRGDKVLVTGDNGAGKSTLMKLFTGFEKDYNGELLLNGHQLKSLPAETLNRYYTILEQNNYIFHTDVAHNLSLYADIDPAAHGEVLDMVGFNEIPQTDPTSQSLSGGEKQRLALARALLREKEILIIDEQLNQIQKDNREKILERLLGDKDLTLFYISHNADEIQNAFNVVLHLDGHDSTLIRRS